MSETLHPEAASMGGASAVDQVAELLRGEAEAVEQPVASEETVDDEVATDTEEHGELNDGELDDGDVETDEPNQEDDHFEGDEEGLAALASELGVETDRLGLNDEGQIVVNMTVNGEKKQVSLSEAISGAQYRAANDQKAQKLSEDRSAFEKEREEVAGAIKARVEQMQGIGQMLEQKMMAEFSTIDWDRLRLTDPSEWTAKQMEFQRAQQELQQAGQMVGEQMRQAQEMQDRQLAEQREQTLQSERALMMQTVPEWSDEERMKGDLEAITNYAREVGFPDDELADIVYNRHLQVLRKAYLYDQGKTVAEKKIKKAPKMQRASNGRFVSNKDTKLNRLIDRAKNARGGEKRDAQAEAVLAILGDR
jgi:hypothetical protein